MRVKFGHSILLLGVVAAMPAMAGKLYKWVDEKGNVHYSDRVPPEAAKLARSEMNKSGVAVKQVARAKTAEELAAEEAQKVKDAEAAKVAQAQAQADAALMAYNTEAELLRARDQELGAVDTNITAAKLTMSSQEKNLSGLLAQAADFERNKKPVPKNVSDAIATVRAQIDTQQRALTEREASKDAIRKDYEGKLARWRALSAKQPGAKTP